MSIHSSKIDRPALQDLLLESCDEESAREIIRCIELLLVDIRKHLLNDTVCNCAKHHCVQDEILGRISANGYGIKFKPHTPYIPWDKS